jgi:anti-sigma B factor antagonist
MFEIQRGDDGRILLNGRFDASQVEKAQAFLDGVSNSCTLDCSGLEYISSAGLSVLLQTLKRLTAESHSLRLIQLRENIRDVFRISGLDRIFNVE